MVVPLSPVLTAWLVGQQANASTPPEGKMQARPIDGIGSGDSQVGFEKSAQS